MSDVSDYWRQRMEVGRQRFEYGLEHGHYPPIGWPRVRRWPLSWLRAALAGKREHEAEHR